VAVVSEVSPTTSSSRIKQSAVEALVLITVLSSSVVEEEEE